MLYRTCMVVYNIEVIGILHCHLVQVQVGQQLVRQLLFSIFSNCSPCVLNVQQRNIYIYIYIYIYNPDRTHWARTVSLKLI